MRDAATQVNKKIQFFNSKLDTCVFWPNDFPWMHRRLTSKGRDVRKSRADQPNESSKAERAALTKQKAPHEAGLFDESN